MLFELVVLVCGIMLTASQRAINNDNMTFNWAMANTSVELAAYSYCSTDSYKSESYEGLLSGFQVTNVIFGAKGFIGILPSMSAIFVVFAGTGSVLDWVVDVDVTLTDYPRCEHCKIHQGFSLVEQVSYQFTLYTVGMLKLFHPGYKVIVAGHSKGGAQATLTALDLKQSGISNVYLVTFGSPRVGNEAFAVYASGVLSDHHYRMTHHKDTVPSVPPRRLGYMHLSGEWYENPTLQLYQCEGYEDPQCSAKWGKRLRIGDDDQRYPTIPPEAVGYNTTTASELGANNTMITSTDDGASEDDFTPNPTGNDITDDDFNATDGHLTLLQIVAAAREDHLYFLGRYVQCPTKHVATDLQTDNNTIRGANTSDVGGAMMYGAQAHKPQAQVQNEVVTFAVVATAIMLVLFAIAVYFILREGREAQQEGSETNGIPPLAGDVNTAGLGTSTDIEESTYRRGVQRETELTPLVRSGNAAKYHAAVEP